VGEAWLGAVRTLHTRGLDQPEERRFTAERTPEQRPAVDQCHTAAIAFVMLNVALVQNVAASRNHTW